MIEHKSLKLREAELIGKLGDAEFQVDEQKSKLVALQLGECLLFADSSDNSHTLHVFYPQHIYLRTNFTLQNTYIIRNGHTTSRQRYFEFQM